eukprot:2124734-Pyramimonas_sp.AAC.1
MSDNDSTGEAHVADAMLAMLALLPDAKFAPPYHSRIQFSRRFSASARRRKRPFVRSVTTVSRPRATPERTPQSLNADSNSPSASHILCL